MAEREQQGGDEVGSGAKYKALWAFVRTSFLLCEMGTPGSF